MTGIARKNTRHVESTVAHDRSDEDDDEEYEEDYDDEYENGDADEDEDHVVRGGHNPDASVKFAEDEEEKENVRQDENKGKAKGGKNEHDVNTNKQQKAARGKPGGLCRGKSDVEGIDSQTPASQSQPTTGEENANTPEETANGESNDRTRPGNKPVKKGGMCKSEKSVQVQESATKPISDKDKQSQLGRDTKNPKQPENKDPKLAAAKKPKGGMCRSDKNVKIEESTKPVSEQPNDPAQGSQSRLSDNASNEDGSVKEEPVYATVVKNKDKAPKGDVENVTVAQEKPGPAPKKSSRGLCRGDKSVEVKDSTRPVTQQQLQQQQQEAINASAEPPLSTQPHANAENGQQKPQEVKPVPAKKSGGLCSGKRSVEVKDSVGKLEQNEDMQREHALPVKGQAEVKDEHFEEDDGEEDGDEEEGTLEEEENRSISSMEKYEVLKKETKKTKKKKGKNVASKKKGSVDEGDVSEEMGEIYLGPEPPPPTLKKSKKQKRGDDYVKDEPLGMGHRRGKYTLAHEGSVEEGTPAKKKTPKKSKRSPAKAGEDEDESQENEPTPQVVKKKKKKAKKVPLDTDPDDVRSVYENQLAHVEAMPLNEEMVNLTASLQPTIEDEDELLDNAKEERGKNKQRLRAKKMKEAEFESPVRDVPGMDLAFANARRDMDRALGPRLEDDEEEGDKKKKSKDKGKKKKEKEGKDNAGFEPEDDDLADSLNEARDKMHELLDNAFSLISQSRASFRSKHSKDSPKSDDDKKHKKSKKSKDSDDSPESEDDKKKKSKKAKKSKSKDSPRSDSDHSVPEGEKAHTPLYVQRSHEPYDSSGLVTWSPYRAGDESNALISMPMAHQNERPVPAAPVSKTTTFSESLPENLKSYYTNQPAEPIVIRTKHLDTNTDPHHNVGGFKEGNGRATTDGSVHGLATRPPRYGSMDKYAEPYHGMSSYDDLPRGGGRTSSGDAGGTDSGSQEGSVIHVMEHKPPRSKDRPNLDATDVISDSLKPGASPQPLIDSLRNELSSLSTRRAADVANGPNGGRGNGAAMRHGLSGSGRTNQSQF